MHTLALFHQRYLKVCAKVLPLFTHIKNSPCLKMSCLIIYSVFLKFGIWPLLHCGFTHEIRWFLILSFFVCLLLSAVSSFLLSDERASWSRCKYRSPSLVQWCNKCHLSSSCVAVLCNRTAYMAKAHKKSLKECILFFFSKGILARILKKIRIKKCAKNLKKKIHYQDCVIIVTGK